MNSAGVFIFCFFAPVWLALAKLNGAPLPWIALALGVCVSMVLIWLNQGKKREPSGLTAEDTKRIGRVFMWSIMGESVGIFAIVNVLTNFGLSDRLMAGIALVVGLHFIPIGLKVPMKIALLIAGVMLAISVVGFVIASAPNASLFVGCAGAVTLWAAVAAPIVQARRTAVND